jgi:hypothetical protein
MAVKGKYRVKVTLGDAVVEVEGEEKGVVAIVKALSNVVRSEQKTLPTTPTLPLLEPSPRLGHIDIRSFFQVKKPSTDIEASAVAAYYYKYLAPSDQRKETIDSTLLQDAFRLAQRPLPAKSAYTLVNAKAAGYLDSTSEQGFYRLNPVGFNLVEHTLGKGEPGRDKKGVRRKKSARGKKRSKGSKK